MTETESEIQEAASDTWPSSTFEQRSWESSGADYGSRKEMRAHRGPYEAAVPATIATVDPDLGIELLAAVEDATTEIARFDAECAADLAPFVALLLLMLELQLAQGLTLPPDTRQVLTAMRVSAALSPLPGRAMPRLPGPMRRRLPPAVTQRSSRSRTSPPQPKPSRPLSSETTPARTRR